MPAGWRDWFVIGLLHLRLRVRPKSVLFHYAENRRRPCRMIWVWMLSAKLNPSTSSHRQGLRCLSPGRKVGVKITCGDWYPPIWCRTKKRFLILGNVLDDLGRTMFSSINRITAEIRERFQQLENLAPKIRRPEVILSMDELNLDQAPQDFKNHLSAYVYKLS
ncbi:hypothetical protein TNCV_1586061 [Trichonephila clavipes]|uniref:Uncharacterized protein n=1 Tax=Trichonephila clavipes TaxID=2585209 RepID=A0A8X6SF15_TRICX|nr:hypothetical protein TNCV_1586061 [Trichonephila clavipes]